MMPEKPSSNSRRAPEAIDAPISQAPAWLTELLQDLALLRKWRRYINEEIRRMNRSGYASFSASYVAETVCNRRNIENLSDRDCIRNLAVEICQARYGRL